MSEANRFAQVLAQAALERARRRALREARETAERAKTRDWAAGLRKVDTRGEAERGRNE